MIPGNKQFTQPNLPGEETSIVGKKLSILPKLGNPHTTTVALGVNDSDVPPLYHGSSEDIKPGEELRLGGPTSKQWAFATTNLSTAKLYAKDRGGREGKSQGKIYRVEPAEENSTFMDTSPHGHNTSAYVSKRFRVVEPTHQVDNNTGAVTPLGNNKPIEYESSRASRKQLNAPRQDVLPIFEDPDRGI